MKLKDFAREVSIVHQYNTAPVALSVEKLVGYGRTPYHTMGLSPDPKEDEEQIRRAMEITHTYTGRNSHIRKLADVTRIIRYMKQLRVIIIGTLMMRLLII